MLGSTYLYKQLTALTRRNESSERWRLRHTRWSSIMKVAKNNSLETDSRASACHCGCHLTVTSFKVWTSSPRQWMRCKSQNKQLGAGWGRSEREGFSGNFCVFGSDGQSTKIGYTSLWIVTVSLFLPQNKYIISAHTMITTNDAGFRSLCLFCYLEQNWQDRQCTCNVTFKRVPESLLPWKRNKYYLLVCVWVRVHERTWM